MYLDFLIKNLDYEYERDISDVSILILPGVGSFKKAMENLRIKI